MLHQRIPASGHVFKVPRKRGEQWYCKYRAHGRQVQKRLGPHWSGRGRPPAGYFTKRSAEAELRNILHEADRGIGHLPRTGATFADAVSEWLAAAERKGLKASTIRSYRNTADAIFAPAFGELPLEKVTTELLEQWRDGLAEGRSPRTVNKYIVELHALFERARRKWKLPINPVADVERLREVRTGDFRTYEPHEVRALCRATANEQDRALFLLLAFSGLRLGEARGLVWEDVGFAGSSLRVRHNYTASTLGTPKSGKVRTVPMVEEVAQALASLGQRDRFTAPTDLVFVGQAGGYLDDSALRRRYRVAQRVAGLPPLRIHDLRHCFGSMAIGAASIVEVAAWMGHAHVSTTSRYLHARGRAADAARLAAAFAEAQPAASSAAAI